MTTDNKSIRVTTSHHHFHADKPSVTVIWVRLLHMTVIACDFIWKEKVVSNTSTMIVLFSKSNNL